MADKRQSHSSGAAGMGGAELRSRHRLAEAGGGEKRLDRQKRDGKLTARQRLAALLDRGSFVELDKFVVGRSAIEKIQSGAKAADTGSDSAEPDYHFGDGVVCGHGTIDGRPVFVFSQDFTVYGGSLSEAVGAKICKIMDLAVETGCPLIGLNDSGGARIQEGVQSLAGYAEIFYRNVAASGVIPQLSAILGPCAGGAVYSPAITDFCFMVEKTSFMFITGPDVIKAVTKESVSKDELGGALTHNHTSGVAHFLAHDEKECFSQIRRLLSFLPQNNRTAPAKVESADSPARRSPELNSVIPENPNQPYDIRSIITAVADGLDFFEVQPLFAANIVIGFLRIGGHSVGVVANQPEVLAGCLDIDASTKAARFVRFCDCFNIPLVTFVDVPGFLPGTKQEFGGIIRHGAKLLYAFAEATVPKITVIARKAYGGAYDVMSSKHIRSDLNFAYPSAEVAVMGPEGAVNVVYRAEIAAAEDPIARHKELVEDYRKRFANPWTAAGLGYIDAVIEPADTRIHLVRALDLLATKKQARPKRKHGNIPL